MNKSATALYLASFLIVVVLATAAATNLSHASETATISIDPATQQFNFTNVGGTIQVNIDVSNVQNLWAWDIANLRFDPSVLNLTQVSQGPLLESAGSTVFAPTLQSTSAISEGDIPDIPCALLVQGSVNGSGVLATLTFQVVSTNKTSQITFNQTTLEGPPPNNEQISCNAINADINVSSVPEFSTWPVLLLLMLATTISTVLFSEKVKRSRK
jgi:hypothetical protein